MSLMQIRIMTAEIEKDRAGGSGGLKQISEPKKDYWRSSAQRPLTGQDRVPIPLRAERITRGAENLDVDVAALVPRARQRHGAACHRPCLLDDAILRLGRDDVVRTGCLGHDEPRIQSGGSTIVSQPLAPSSPGQR
jgi:hypothetical protein